MRNYNQAFSSISIISNLDANLANESDGVYTFRVDVEFYHRIGSFEAQDRTDPQFYQIYFMDPDSFDLDTVAIQIIEALQSSYYIGAAICF
jgi:hypothetical protein